MMHYCYFSNVNIINSRFKNISWHKVLSINFCKKHILLLFAFDKLYKYKIIIAQFC